MDKMDRTIFNKRTVVLQGSPQETNYDTWAENASTWEKQPFQGAPRQSQRVFPKKLQTFPEKLHTRAYFFVSLLKANFG